MTNKILPCKCGHQGELLGQGHDYFLSLTCPICHEAVEAFTLPGLVEAWNRKNEQQPATQEQAE